MARPTSQEGAVSILWRLPSRVPHPCIRRQKPGNVSTAPRFEWCERRLHPTMLDLRLFQRPDRQGSYTGCWTIPRRVTRSSHWQPPVVECPRVISLRTRECCR